MALLRFLFIFFLVSYVIYLIGKWWLGWKIKKMKKDFEARGTSQQNHRKEGDVHVDFNPGSKKIINDDDGDYVDFEEVDK